MRRTIREAIKTAPAELPATNTATEPITPLLLTEAQGATLLNISQRKLWELAACGVIPSIKVGTAKRYRRTDLEDWVQRGCPTERDA